MRILPKYPFKDFSQSLEKKSLDNLSHRDFGIVPHTQAQRNHVGLRYRYMDNMYMHNINTRTTVCKTKGFHSTRTDRQYAKVQTEASAWAWTQLGRAKARDQARPRDSVERGFRTQNRIGHRDRGQHWV